MDLRTLLLSSFLLRLRSLCRPLSTAAGTPSPASAVSTVIPLRPPLRKSMAAPLLRPPASSSILVVFFLLSCVSVRPILASAGSSAGAEVEAEEEFSEELLLRPLPDRKVLSHFHFQSSTPHSAALGRHHRLFPKAVAQLVQKFRVRELELSFTQGRWNYEKWGGSDPMSSINAKPPGVELWALFDIDLPIGEIDSTWKNLTHALSGLFCASINFLESSTASSSPLWGFPSNSSNLRYGALPREAVCTENLTPWLKLLPCRDKAGIASLLYRPSVYKGHYHSQRLRLISTKLTGIVLDQTLTVVLQPNNAQRSSPMYSDDKALQPSWSTSSVFRNKVTGQCVLAKTSRIFFELEKDLVAGLGKQGFVYSWSNPVFKLSTPPESVIRELDTVQGESASVIYVFEVANYNKHMPLDVGITWKLPVIWSSSQAPYHASRFLMGSGNERGSIAISLQSTRSREWFLSNSQDCKVQVIVFQVVPWYVKVYYHTLQIFMDGKAHAVSDVVEKIRVSPSEDKASPGSLEMLLKFPCSMRYASLSLDFDKGFLHIDEYPPDANQGFDIPSALVSFPDLYSSRRYSEYDSARNSPLLSKFKERNLVLSYTEVLLVPLTTPDFSMPYNVITFTCTVLALYFGSLLNVLRRRIGEEERLLNSQDTKRGLIPHLLSKLSSKLTGHVPESSSASSTSPSSPSIMRPKLLFKVASVAVIAVVWHYYFSGR